MKTLKLIEKMACHFKAREFGKDGLLILRLHLGFFNGF